MNNLEIKITEMLKQIGIPANIKGYRFLREEIKMVIEDFSTVNSITKEIYPTIAHQFNSTPSRVERATRHAITTAWDRGNIKLLNEIFGRPTALKSKPTNSEFIAVVADKFLMEMSASEKNETQYHIYYENGKYGVCNDEVKTEPVFFEKQWAEYFIKQINEVGDVSPIHLNDILEDFLVSYSF